ncbi:hypothetical protein M6B22_16170 [Jatrophihabitans cynanchi]|uniref:Uncharacterized protein n=1 Tax=Jatrophihabitans cynanchi TaxID=2944128 RepID=A0ABY7JU35_9ACTN|nr:hypothetical protein [Jatrophihabitans sp. SB3-54]WAX56063.1 hypothetical protein M6B22_16170 [Jatrophihabitans sp. SB3-54]
MTAAALSQPRLRAALPFATVGAACVVGGGVVAAATAHAPTEHALWAVAYLVLVGGVGQLALGAGQAWLAGAPPSTAVLAVEFAAWNVGNAAVIAGTIAGIVWLTDVGGVLLVLALALLLTGTAGARPGWLLRGYRALIVIVLVSIPIGLVLARVRG